MISETIFPYICLTVVLTISLFMSLSLNVVLIFTNKSFDMFQQNMGELNSSVVGLHTLIKKSLEEPTCEFDNCPDSCCNGTNNKKID